MPERFRTGAFEPEFVTMLVAVLADACHEVEKHSGQPPSEDVRNALAKAIMEAAEQGQTDPAMLKSRALAAIPGWAPAAFKNGA